MASQATLSMNDMPTPQSFYGSNTHTQPLPPSTARTVPFPYYHNEAFASQSLTLPLVAEDDQWGFDPALPPVSALSVKPEPSQQQPILDPTPSPQRVTKRTTRRSQGKQAGEPEETPEQKREKFLERNRTAAKKCRQKKKEYNDLLLRLYSEASDVKLRLQEEFEELMATKVQLKDQLLMHARCDDDAINRHLEAMVTQLRHSQPPVFISTPPELLMDPMDSSPMSSSQPSVATTRHGSFDLGVQRCLSTGSLDYLHYSQQMSSQALIDEPSPFLSEEPVFDELINYQ